MVGKCSVWLDSYEREETFVVNLFFLGLVCGSLHFFIVHVPGVACVHSYT